MSDQKISQLTTLTSLASADLFLVTDDVAGSPISKAIRADAMDTVVVVRGAVADGVTDDTAIIQAAIDAVYAAGGGTVFIPAGNYGVTALALTFNSRISVNLRGAGRRGTKLTKIGATTTPVIHFEGSALYENDLTFADFEIIGNGKAHDGLRVESMVRLTFERLYLRDCDTGLDNVGALIFNVYDCTIADNNRGYFCTQKNNVAPNLTNFFGNIFIANTVHAVDLDYAAGVHFYGTDFEANGTTTDLTTGAVRIRDTTDDLMGYSQVTFNGCWFEANLGMTAIIEDATNTNVTFKDSMLLLAEGGNTMDCGAIHNLHLENVVAPTGGGTPDTITSAAYRTVIIGGSISNYVDNSSTVKMFLTGGAYTSHLETPVLALVDGEPTPATLAGFASIYVDSADGDLKVKFGDGTVKTIVVDT